jgi:flagellar hook-basal body protein
MSFYTSLTGLNSASAQLGVTSNNIANVGTTGFKRSRADFGDIFATSPLQKSSSAIGQGVSLKQVSQEFSQGNISFSSNTLDLAISGDGFFPLKSADGLQDIYTRNGAFTLNGQFNVVNSAGQRLMAATVDSTGSANVNDRVVLTIPQTTVGEAKQTSLVQLGVNFPADAKVITDPFSRTNAASYNKSTALTVYDQGGNGYLATIYYVKTQNATQASPFNKWQTHVYIGTDEVKASLMQASDSNKEPLYVNQYGVTEPYSLVKDFLTNNAKTQKFSLNQLTDTQVSVPASITSSMISTDLAAGVDFKSLLATQTASATAARALVAGAAATASAVAITATGSGAGAVALAAAVAAAKLTPATLTGAAAASATAAAAARVLAANVSAALAAGAVGTAANTAVLDTAAAAAGATASTNYINAVGTATSVAYVAAAGKAASDAVLDAAAPVPSLSNLFKIEVDGSAVNVDLSFLQKSSTPLNGTQIAAEMTNYLSNKFGDERYFELPTDGTGSKFVLTVDGVAHSFDFGPTLNSTAGALPAKLTTDSVVTAMQTKLDAANMNLTASYDAAGRSFKFVDTVVDPLAVPRVISISADPANPVMGLTSATTLLGADGLMANEVTPNSDTFIRAQADQRFGMTVTYNTGNKNFIFSSGTTGDKSTISITPIDNTGTVTTDAGINPLATSIFGLKTEAVTASTLSLRGVASTHAVAYGTSPSINMKNNFSVSAENNTFIVTVDDVSGTVTIPVGADYSLEGFKKELQNQINLLADSTGKSVSGVKVDFDNTAQRFTFTSSTATSNSFIKVTGKGPWGLEAAQNGQGKTSSWIRPTQSTDATGKLVYIDAQGKETTSGDGFVTAPKWTPIYLDKGELTFDTGGKLVSPLAGAQLETVFLQDGKGALTININYSKSTQYTSPFAVLSQTQDGAPEGDLVGVTIGNDGLVSASYSNGTQKSLAKILLVNFSNPTGLRQVGDSSFLTSAASGNPILGTAGSAGFGTIRAGATERSNVDLTQELVDLITAQRNFQANAKAIETSTTMTQAIINIRG